MACDRFVRWEDVSKKPTSMQVREVLEDYLGFGGWIYNNEDDWFTVQLPGLYSHPLRRQNTHISDAHGERFFEVCCIHDDSIDVITRLADEFTNNVADGFAKLIARWFEGNLDE